MRLQRVWVNLALAGLLNINLIAPEPLPARRPAPQPQSAAKSAPLTSAALPAWFTAAAAEAPRADPKPLDSAPARAALPGWFAPPAAPALGAEVQAAAPAPAEPAAALPGLTAPAASWAPAEAPAPAAPLAILPAWFAPPNATAPAAAPAAELLLNTVYTDALFIDGPLTIRHGETVTYTIVGENDASPTTGVIMTATPPAGFTPAFQTFTIGALAADEVFTRYAVFTADNLAVSGQLLLELSQDGGPTVVQVEPVTVLPGVPAGSLAVLGPAEINNCETVTYTLVLTNSGALTDVTGLVLTNTMPAGFTPAQQVFALGALAPGAVLTREAVYQSSCSAVSGQNIVTLAQDGAADLVRLSSFVVNPGAITLRKEPAVIQAQAGDVVTWTVYVDNTGYGTVYNVAVTDTLGAGLTWVSGPLTATYASLAAGQEVSFTVAARVTACALLDNNVEAIWGCDVCQRQTARASVDLKVNNPALAFTPPPINIDYCSNTGAVAMPIANTGLGNANRVFIGVDLNAFTVGGLSAGAVYSPALRGFVLSDPIPPGGVYTLTYSIAFPNACAAGASGNLIYQPAYYDDCGKLFSFPVKSGTWARSGAAPNLTVSVDLPGEIQLGDVVTTPVIVNAANIAGTVAVTQTIPDGWTVLDPAGGVLTSTGVLTYLVWTGVAGNAVTVFNPVLASPSAASSSACTYCGLPVATSVHARATDCQNCARAASDSDSTEVQCNLLVAGDKVVTPSSDETCSTYTYTNTYTFAGAFPAGSWASMRLTETLANAQTFVPGTLLARVFSGTETYTLTAASVESGGRLVVTFADPGGVPVPGATLEVVYQLETTAGSASACSGATWYDWTYFDTGVASAGPCGAAGVLQEGVYVSSQAPQMALTIRGAPPIVSSCGVYTVSLDLARTSSAPAYDAVLDVLTDTYAILDVLGTTGVAPVSTTQDAQGYHFFFGDGFTAATTSTIDLRVQLRCTSSAAPLSASLRYDDRCRNDAAYDRTCSVGGALATPTVLSPRLILYKFPEVIYATSDLVTWTLTAINSGSGTAYGVTLTDTLGSGLRYVSASLTSTQGSVLGASPPLTSTHAVTWTNLTLLPGEKATITFLGEVVGCTGLTNTFAGEQGCQGAVCSVNTPLFSQVVLPPTVLVNTNNTVSSIGNCLTRTITATVRNAGLLSVYDAAITETLPAGMTYLPGTAEVALGTGTTPPGAGWAPAGDPVTAGGAIVWTSAELPALARLYPAQTLWVRFAVRASCTFAGGFITIQTSYRDTCRTAVASASDYATTAVPAVVSVQKYGRNLTTGGPWTTRVNAASGQQVQWVFTVTNVSETPAFNLVVTDTLPPNLDLSSLAIEPPPAGRSGSVITWSVGTLTQTTWTALITGTLSSAACSVADTVNAVLARWGCDDGCRQQATAQASLRTRPVFAAPSVQTEFSPASLSRCGGVITLTLNNDGPPASGVILTDTLPAGYFFQELVSASTAPDTGPAPGAAAPAWTWAGLPAGLTTLAFRVNSGTTGACAAPTGGPNRVDLQYDDEAACVATPPYTATASTSVAVTNPVLAATVTPRSQTADAGQVVTWTLAVTNTGNGLAPNIVITDVLGAGFTLGGATAGVYPSGSTTPGVAGNVIVWSPAITLAAGQSWSAVVTGTVLAAGAHANALTAAGDCASGCSYGSTSASGFTSLVGGFDKGPSLQTRTIGEAAVFTFTTSLPAEAALYQDLILTDSLPAGLAYAGAVLTATSETGLTTLVTDTPTLSGSQLVWTLGALTGSVQIDAVITTTVQDLLTNTAGVRRTNVITFTYTDAGLPYRFSDTADVDLIEPRLATAKTVTPTAGVQAGDVLTYVVTVTNTGTSPAYDTVLTDTLAQGTAFAAGVCVPAGTLTSTASTAFLDGDPLGSWDLAPGGTLVCTYTVTATAGLYVNGTHTNTVDADWSTLDGGAAGERVYTDTIPHAMDGAQDTASAVFSVAGVSFAKTDGGVTRATLGDVVLYTLAITSPLGTLRSLVVTDTLPAGLRYTVGTQAVAGIATTPAFAISGPNDGSAPTTLTWTFGDAEVTASPAYLTFTAVVVNVAGNQIGTARTNTAGLRHSNAAGVAQPALTGSDGLTIAEPVLTLSKAIAAAASPADAGGVVTYSVYVSNTTGVNNVAAHDVVLTDVLPAALALVPGSVSFTASAGASGVATDAAPAALTLTVAALPPGEGVNVSFAARLVDTVAPGQVVTNTAAAVWTSQPGANADERRGGATLYNSNSVANDYELRSNAVFTTAAPAFDKLAVAPVSYTIGQPVTYTLLITVPEGAANNVVVTDTLPAAMGFVSAQVVTGAAQSGGTLAADYNGAVTSAPALGGSGSAVTFSFGAITTTADDDPANNRFALLVTARVSNTLSNQNGTALTNTAALRYTNPNTGRPTALSDPTGAGITVVEPVLSLAKTVLIAPTPVEAGKVVTYQVVLAHAAASRAPAYDVVLTDVVPAALVNPVILGVAAGGLTPPSAEAAGALLRVPAAADGAFDLPQGAVVTLTFQAELAGSVSPGLLVTNTAVVTWTTLPGPEPFERGSGNGLLNGGGLNDYEVQSSAGLGIGGANFSKHLAGTSAAHTAGANVVIGEVLTYTLAVTLPEGLAPGLVITDLLPAGLAYVPGSAALDTAGFAGSVDAADPALAAPGGDGADVVFTFNSPVTVTADGDPGNNTLRLTLAARVLDTAGNQAGTALVNGASLRVAAVSATANTVTASLVEPALALAKTADDPTPLFGQTVVYTLTITHAPTSTADALDVVITDTLPAGLSYVPGSALVAPAGAVSEAPPTLVFSVPALALGAGTVITYQAVVAAPQPPTHTVGTVLTNAVQAEWTSLPGPDAGERTGRGGVDDYRQGASQAVTVSGVDLRLAKTDGGGAGTPGGLITYTLTLTNAGNLPAASVVITDLVPAYTTFITATDDGLEAGGLVVWPAVTLTAGLSLTRTVTVRVVEPLPAGVTSTLNLAEAADDGASGPEPTPEDNSASDSTPLNAAPDLQISKSDGVTVAVPGQTLTYTLTITNAGGQDAAGVLITDTLPAHTVFVAASDGGLAAGGVITWPAVSLAGGASLTRTVTARVSAPAPAGVTTLVNTAVAADDGANGPEPTPGDNTATDTDTLSAAPDLRISKSDGGLSAAPGGLITYTLAYTNTGDQGAAGVTITDAVPAHTAFQPALSTAGWACAPDDNAGSACTFPVGALAGGGGTGVISFVVRVVQPLAAGLTQTVNTASIGDDGGNGPDPTPDDNQSSDTTPLNAAPDLQISKSDGGLSAAPGGLVTYTLAYTNAGDQDAQGVTITDVVPAGASFQPALSAPGWACAPDNASGSVCVLTVGALPSGAGGAVTFTVQAAAPLPAGLEQLANTAVIADDGANGPDPRPGDNTGSDTTPLSAAPDLSLGKDDGRTVAAAGDTLTYTLVVTNAGGQDAAGVLLTDTLPASVSFVAASDGGTAAAGRVTWPAVSLAGGASLTRTVTVQVVSPVPAGVSVLTNTAVVADDGTGGADPTPGDTTATDVDAVDAVPDLQLAKTDGLASALPGQILTYTLSITNAGTRDATGVLLTDTLPAHVGLVAASDGGLAAGGVITWPAFALPGLSAVTRTVTVRVDDPLPAGAEVITNTAEVGDDGLNGPDPRPGDNTAVDADTLAAAPDLQLTKSDGGLSAAPGGVIAYTLTYTNVGRQPALNVVVTETVPVGASFVLTLSLPAVWSCADGSPAGTLCTAALGTLLPGAGGTLPFAVAVQPAPLPAGANPIANTAVIADDGASGPDPSPGDNTAAETTPLAGVAPDLQLAKTDGLTSTVPGALLTYTLTLTNAGNIAAAGVTMTDTLPAPVSFLSASDGGVLSAGVVTWPAITLAGGASVTRTVTVRVDTPLPAGTRTLANLAGAADDGTNGADPTPGDNSAVDTDAVDIQLDLQLVKTVNQAVVAPGEGLTFTLAYTNAAAIGGSGIVITETVPAGTFFNAAACAPAVWSCADASPAGTVCTHALGTLAGGASGAVRFALTVDPALTPGAVIHNAALIGDDGASGTDPTPANNASAASASVVPPTAVTLLYFRVERVTDGAVILGWATALERDTFRFVLYRAPAAVFEQAGVVGVVPAALPGGAPDGAVYTFSDSPPGPGPWWYWLVEEDTAGRPARYGPVTTAFSGLTEPHTLFLPLLAAP
ncbi:MAG: DUF11 domain-containing protein [Anaerolineales bacterium]|nr:DUF11 domain-containing protein [Anaerolineales bacterium]